MNAKSPEQFLKPLVIQGSGVLGVVASAIFWAFTGRIEPVLLTAFGTMITYGVLLQAKTDAKNGKD